LNEINTAQKAGSNITSQVANHPAAKRNNDSASINPKRQNIIQ